MFMTIFQCHELDQNFNVFFRFIFDKCGAMQQREPETEQRENLASNESSQSSDVETELFIGLPERRSKH